MGRLVSSDDLVKARELLALLGVDAPSQAGQALSVADTARISLLLSSGVLSADVVLASLTAAHVAVGAAIPYSKLSLTGGIVNADVAGAAAIAYAKLALTGGIVNADVAGAAAIAYAKLALTGSVVNADIAGAAAIAYAKLALTGSVVNADIAGAAAIAYAKLALTGSIVDADVAAAAAVARTKLAGGTPNRLVYNVVTTGKFGDVAALTPGMVIRADGSGIPQDSVVSEAALSASALGRANFSVAGVTEINVAIPSASEQCKISVRFTPATDDVMFDATVSQDGVTYENSASQYDYIGEIHAGASYTGFTQASAGGATDRIHLQFDNNSASAGVGNASNEGIWGDIYVRNRGVNGLQWPTLAWELNYRNTATAARTVRGHGSRTNGERITHIKFFFEGLAAFTGVYSVTPIA